MKGRLRSTLMRLPGGAGYRLARALHVRKPGRPPADPGIAPADRSTRSNGSSSAPLTVELEQEGRHKRLRVRATGDIWSEDFREELARDRHFEASLVWRELAVLALIVVVLAARTISG
jgi:hypothetical protein